MSDGSEFQVCGAVTENARRANSVRVLAADSSGTMQSRMLSRVGPGNMYYMDEDALMERALLDVWPIEKHCKAEDFAGWAKG